MLSRPRPAAVLVALALATAGALVAAPAHAATTTVTGAVTLAPGPAAAGAQVQVTAVPADGDLSDPGLETASVNPATGAFSLDVADEGDYDFYFSDVSLRPEYAAEWWDDATDRALATTTTLDGSDLTLGDVELALLPPVEAIKPTISGSPDVEGTLTAFTNGWKPLGSTVFSYEWLADGVPIAGQTERTLTLTTAQTGQRISVRVTGWAPKHSRATQTSDQVGPVAALPDETILGSMPFINGDAAIGQTLTVDVGTWSPAGVTLSYRWFVGDVATAVTADSFVLTDAMVGKTVRVEVTGSKGTLTPVTYSSPATPPVRGNVVVITGATPTIGGQARVGATLSVVEGAWTPAAVAFSYQWYADGRAVDGATSRTFVATDAYVGQRMSVDVTGSLAGSAPVTRNSAETDVVVGEVHGAKPRVKGKAVVGKTLTAKVGTWTPATVALTYVWLRNGKVIKGAKAAAYKLTRKDAGKKISVRVTGRASGFESTVMTSKATKKVKR